MTTVEVRPDVGIWAISGAPRETARIEDPVSSFEYRIHFGGIDNYKHNGFDYLDMGLSYKHGDNLPGTFQGVSGGGLWSTQVTYVKDTNEYLWNRNLDLEGIAFYEHLAPVGSFIRCHGRRSIYEKGVDAVRNHLTRRCS
jgi:hypothetical protein